MIVSMPAVISQSSFGLAVAHLRNALPLAGQGLSWVVPMDYSFNYSNYYF